MKWKWLILFICLIASNLSPAQRLDGKWSWLIRGSSLDIQADYRLELNLKQDFNRVFGTQTLFLKNYPDVIIWVEGTVDGAGHVELKSKKTIQFKLPDSVMSAKNFTYSFDWFKNENSMFGTFTPHEDSSKLYLKNSNPNMYEAVYKNPWRVNFTKVNEKLDSVYSRILNENNPVPTIQTELQHTIKIPDGDLLIQLYDNGTVDGDIIDLIVNGNQVLSNQKLSLSPIEWKIKKEDFKDSSVIAMRAENLGEIPPNTGLMLITVGGERFDLNLSSTLDKQAGVMVVREMKVKSKK